MASTAAAAILSRRPPPIVVAAEASLTESERAHIESGGETDLANDGAEAGVDASLADAGQQPADDKQPAAQERQQVVPHQALHAEREEHKTTKAQLAEANRVREETQREATVLRARTDKILETLATVTVQPPAAAAAATEPAPVPPFETDPAGHILGLLAQQGVSQRQIMEEIGRLRGDNAQTAQQRQQQEALAQVGNRSAAMEREFMAKTADYSDAINHLHRARGAQLTALGFTDPAQIADQIRREAVEVAVLAAQNNRNPAEIAYELARASGYQPRQAAAGGQAPAAVALPASEANAARLRTVDSGQKQNDGIANMGGARTTPLTANALLKMSEAEFDAMIGTPEGRALLGN